LQLLNLANSVILPFIQAADDNAARKGDGVGSGVISSASKNNAIVQQHSPTEISSIIDLNLPNNGTGKEGLVDLMQRIFRYSVNTWDQGFMDKLYSTTNPVSVRGSNDG